MSSHGRIQISFVLQICVPNSVTLSLSAPCYNHDIFTDYTIAMYSHSKSSFMRLKCKLYNRADGHAL